MAAMGRLAMLLQRAGSRPRVAASGLSALCPSVAVPHVAHQAPQLNCRPCAAPGAPTTHQPSRWVAARASRGKDSGGSSSAKDAGAEAQRSQGAKGDKGGAADPAGGKAGKQKGALAEADEAEDGFLDEDLLEDEGEYEEDGEYEEGGEADEDEDGEGEYDYAESFLEPDDAAREVVTGGTGWGDTVLRAAEEVLAAPAMKGLELYLFRVLPGSKKVDIRLDKMTDMYGSPSIDDIERFSRSLFTVLDRELGTEAAGDISFEVSSPGAERLVAVPEELGRFGELPLRVEYRTPDGKDASAVLLLESLDEAAATSVWKLANVRANATVKGRALSKRQLSQAVSLPLADILRVRIHVDF